MVTNIEPGATTAASGRKPQQRLIADLTTLENNQALQQAEQAAQCSN
jgi:hypothetical protein